MSAQRRNGLGSCKPKPPYREVGFAGVGPVIITWGIAQFDWGCTRPEWVVAPRSAAAANKGGTTELAPSLGRGFLFVFSERER